MIVFGVDLSGPVNTAGTALACFAAEPERLRLLEVRSGMGDEAIYELLASYLQQGPLVVGLDAPLSYNPGGGDRPADRRLRQKIIAAGLPAGAIMTPTMTRMAYLTLRGIHLAHMLRALDPRQVAIAETHPGAIMVLRGAAVEQVRQLKSSSTARTVLLGWLDKQGLQGAAGLQDASDHLVAACACALGAWAWQRGRPAWLHPAQPPAHPFPFAC